MIDQIYISTVPDYNVTELIGEGSYSEVFLGRHKKLGIDVALKFCKTGEFMKNDELQYLQREIEIMRKVHHPFIIELYDVIMTENFTVFVMEYVSGGSLLDFLNENEIDEDQSRWMFFQLLTVIHYLHTRMHIAHRDIKAENIMLDGFGNIRVIDFGLSKFFNKFSKLTTACGSPAYIAPEIYNHDAYNEKADIWSLGIILFALNANFLPFDDQNISKMRMMVLNDEPEYPTSFSLDLVDLLQHLLKKDPHKRMTIDEIVHHKWMIQDSPSGKMRFSFSYLKPHFISSKDIDESIAQFIKRLGFDASDLQKKIKENSRDKEMVAYRALFRQKHSKQLASFFATALVPVAQPKLKENSLIATQVKALKIPTRNFREGGDILSPGGILSPGRSTGIVFFSADNLSRVENYGMKGVKVVARIRKPVTENMKPTAIPGNFRIHTFK